MDPVFLALQAEGAGVIDPASLFFGEGERGRVEADGHALHVDGDHLSAYGARQLRPLLEPMFAEIAGRRTNLAR